MAYTPQAGIFALGTSSHAYLEFDILDAKKHKEFASTISSIREPRTTTGGVNFVIGFRPELWRDICPDDTPPGVEGFNSEIRGTEGFVMPSTQHDALVWLSGSAYDVVFDMARSVLQDFAGQASLGEETSSWPYRHDRDLTGFIDGSENPTLLEAPITALLPEGVPGAAGSVLLLQKWKHNVGEWEALPIEQQERTMGRSHVARTDQDEFGKIFRRNMPYGTVHDHGTVFVGFSADQKRLSRMLDSMAVKRVSASRVPVTRPFPRGWRARQRSRRVETEASRPEARRSTEIRWRLLDYATKSMTFLIAGRHERIGLFLPARLYPGMPPLLQAVTPGGSVVPHTRAGSSTVERSAVNREP